MSDMNDDRHYSEIEQEQIQEQQTANLLMEPELEFLKDLRVHTINGKPVLGNEELPFNVNKIFYEKDFVDTWLIQFALGNAHGINYFNHQAWFKETNMGTLSVMVIDEEGKPVLLVPPITSNNMSKEDYDLLRMASHVINANMNDNMKKNDPNATNDVANKLDMYMSKRALTLTDLVADEFYARHNIVPVVEQQAMYIRDVINNGTMDIKDYIDARLTLYKIYRKEAITDDEKEQLKTVTRGEFTFDDTEQTASPEENDTDKNEPYNPLEC